MANKQHIKIFSHNDLDGFGAPVLLKTLQPYLFKNATFDLTTCSAGNLDRELSYWFRQPSLHQYNFAKNIVKTVLHLLIQILILVQQV